MSVTNGPVQLRLPMQRNDKAVVNSPNPNRGGAARRRVLGRVERLRPKLHGSMLKKTGIVLGGLAAIGFVYVAAVGVYDWARTTPAFALASVKVTMVNAEGASVAIADVNGSTHTSREELLRYLSVQPGDNLVSLGLDSLRSNILRHPWVKTASLRRELPSTLHVEITEHEARGVVSLGSLYLVDDDGEVFARAGSDATHEFSVITGPTREMYEQDRGEWNRLLSLAFSFADAAKELELSLGEVHVDDTLGITAYLLPSGVPAAFGQGDFLGKIERLKKTRSLLQRDGQQVESYLLDNERHPEWVVARVTKANENRNATLTAAR